MYGHQLNKKFTVAGGTGIELNEVQVAGFDFDTQFNSLFVFGRYSLINKKVRLFAFGRAGYGFSAEIPDSETQVEHQGGLTAKYGISLLFGSRSSSKFKLSLGHYLQSASGRETFLDIIGNDIDTEYDILINRLILSFGWDF